VPEREDSDMIIPYELTEKRLDTEEKIKKEIGDPHFLDSYTRKTLSEVLRALDPYAVLVDSSAYTGMTKQRMYRHLLGYVVLKR
jgi:hypothetical protein